MCSDGTYLREQKHEQGAKRTVVVMLQVSTCVNEIKNFERTQRSKSLLLSEFTIAALHHYSCFASMTLPYFMYFIQRALDFCKVRIKLLGLTFKGKQNIFPNQQPSSSAASYLHYKATMMLIAITCLHSLILTLGMCKSTGTTRMTQLLAIVVFSKNSLFHSHT